jgi:predicted nucleic acid-binding protein
VSPAVIDASIVAKAFFEEEHSEECRALLRLRRPFLAPDLLRVEFASVVWKRFRRSEIDRPTAAQILADSLQLPVEIESSEGLVGSALEIAMSTDRSVYDCLYIALAVKHGCPLITADQRLVNALASGSLAKTVRLVVERHE